MKSIFHPKGLTKVYYISPNTQLLSYGADMKMNSDQTTVKNKELSEEITADSFIKINVGHHMAQEHQLMLLK